MYCIKVRILRTDAPCSLTFSFNHLPRSHLVLPRAVLHILVAIIIVLVIPSLLPRRSYLGDDPVYLKERPPQVKPRTPGLIRRNVHAYP